MQTRRLEPRKESTQDTSTTTRSEAYSWVGGRGAGIPGQGTSTRRRSRHRQRSSEGRRARRGADGQTDTRPLRGTDDKAAARRGRATRGYGSPARPVMGARPPRGSPAAAATWKRLEETCGDPLALERLSSSREKQTNQPALITWCDVTEGSDSAKKLLFVFNFYCCLLEGIADTLPRRGHSSQPRCPSQNCVYRHSQNSQDTERVRPPGAQITGPANPVPGSVTLPR